MWSSFFFRKKPSATSPPPPAVSPRPRTESIIPLGRWFKATFQRLLFSSKNSLPQPSSPVFAGEPAVFTQLIASHPSPQFSTPLPKYQTTLPSTRTAPHVDTHLPVAAVSQHLIPVGLRAPDSLWETALKTLPERDQRLLGCGNVEGSDVLDWLIEMAKEQRGICIQKQLKLTWDGKIVILRDVVDKVLTSIERFKEVGDITHAVLPWVGFRLLFQGIGDDYADMGVIMIGLEKVSKLLNYCAVYEGLYRRLEEESAVLENLQNVLISVYTATLQCVAAAIKFYEQETADRIAAGLLHCEEFHARLEALDGKALGAHDAANKVEIEWFSRQQVTGIYFKPDNALELLAEKYAVSIDESRKLREILQELKGPIMRTDLGIAASYDDLEDSDAVKILKWISSTPYKQHHQQAKHGRVERTGEWLLGNDGFREWRGSSSTTVLWLYGILGSGKTKLTSSVVDSLLNDLRTRNHTEGFAYFYCDRNECERRDPDFILRAILKQLSNRVHTCSIHKSIIYRYKLREDNASLGSLCRLTLQECKELIIELLSVYPHSTIIIDGLDECDPQKRDMLLDLLQEIVMLAHNVVKIFLTSRGPPSPADCLKLIPTLVIEMDNTEDIGRFVGISVRRSIEDRKLLDGRDDEALKELISSALTTKATGCFLWVDFHTKLLSQMAPGSDVKGKLRKLPPSLEGTYEEIFGEQIGTGQENDKLLAHAAMKWIMCSTRPLSPDELVEASNVGLPTSSSNADINTILEACHSLVVIDREANVVRFAHTSVHEFLQRKGWDSIQTNAVAAGACLSTIVNVLHPHSSSTPHTPFVLYSIYYWPHHAQLCDDGKNIHIQLKSFLGTLETPAQSFLNWLTFIGNKPHQEYEPEISWYPNLKANLDADPPSILPAICYFGLQCILRDYLDSAQVIDINKRNKLGLSLLSLASGAGHEKIVRILIDRGAVVNQPGGTYGYALHYASALGQERTVRVLLEKGADIHRMGWNGKPALAAAALEGQDGVVRILLENGGSIHANSAFVAAAARQNVTVLRTLAENGVDLSHQRQTMFDALRSAATQRVTENVRFLLSVLKSNAGHDRELSAIGSHTARSAVTAGSMEVLLTIFEMLPGANLDLPSKESGKTALQIALEYESGVIADFLISRGANIRLLKGLLISQLQWASNELWFPELQAFLGTRSSLDDPLLTPEDVLQVQSLLRKVTRLPVHLVNSILDLGEYWIYTECSREENLAIAQHHEQRPYVQLPIMQSRLDSPVRKIVFSIRSHDQGWTSEEEKSRGTYHGSWTWFEAGVTQGTGPQAASSVTTERREIQRNLTAVYTATTHTVTWDFYDGKSADWLKTLASGQAVGVYPRALYGGWVNYVERVDMRLYCAWV